MKIRSTLTAFALLAGCVLSIQAKGISSRFNENLWLSRHVGARFQYLAIHSDNPDGLLASVAEICAKNQGVLQYPTQNKGSIRQSKSLPGEAALMYMHVSQNAKSAFEALRELQHDKTLLKLTLLTLPAETTDLATAVRRDEGEILLRLTLKQLEKTQDYLKDQKNLLAALEIILMQQGWAAPAGRADPASWKGPLRNKLELNGIEAGKDFVEFKPGQASQ